MEGLSKFCDVFKDRHCIIVESPAHCTMPDKLMPQDAVLPCECHHHLLERKWGDGDSVMNIASSLLPKQGHRNQQDIAKV
jgi:hypothetical protein